VALSNLRPSPVCDNGPVHTPRLLSRWPSLIEDSFGGVEECRGLNNGLNPSGLCSNGHYFTEWPVKWPPRLLVLLAIATFIIRKVSKLGLPARRSECNTADSNPHRNLNRSKIAGRVFQNLPHGKRALACSCQMTELLNCVWTGSGSDPRVS